MIAAEARNLTKLPARFTDRIEVKVDLTRRVGQQIHPALNTCADSVTSEIFKEDLRVLQSKHVWGLGVSKKASSDAVFGRDEIYTGDDPDRKIAKSKCADALVLAGAYFKLLEQAYDEEESTPETRYVLRRALGQR